MEGTKTIELTSHTPRHSDGQNSTPGLTETAKFGYQQETEKKTSHAPLQALQTLVSNAGAETVNKTSPETQIQTTANTMTATPVYTTTRSTESVSTVAANVVTNSAGQLPLPVVDEQRGALVTAQFTGAVLIDGTLKMPIQRLSPQTTSRRATGPRPKAVQVYGPGSSGIPMAVPLSSDLQSASSRSQTMGSNTGSVTGSTSENGALQAKLSNSVKKAADPSASCNLGKQTGGVTTELPVMNPVILTSKMSSVLQQLTTESLPQTGVSVSASGNETGISTVKTVAANRTDGRDPIDMTVSHASSLTGKAVSRQPVLSENRETVVATVSSPHLPIARTVSSSPYVAQHRQLAGHPSLILTQEQMLSRSHVTTPNFSGGVFPYGNHQQAISDQHRKLLQSAPATQVPSNLVAFSSVLVGSSQSAGKANEQKLGQALAAAMACQTSAITANTTFSQSVLVKDSNTASFQSGTTSLMPSDSNTQLRASSRLKSRKPPYRPAVTTASSPAMPASLAVSRIGHVAKPVGTMTPITVASHGIPYMTISSAGHTGVYRRMVDTRSQRNALPSSAIVSTTMAKTNELVPRKAPSGPIRQTQRSVDNSPRRSLLNVRSLVSPPVTHAMSSIPRAISGSSPSQQAVSLATKSAVPLSDVSRAPGYAETLSSRPAVAFTTACAFTLISRPFVAKPSTVEGTRMLVSAPRTGETQSRGPVKTCSHAQVCGDTKPVVSVSIVKVPSCHGESQRPVVASISTRPSNLVVQRMASEGNMAVMASGQPLSSQPANSVTSRVVAPMSVGHVASLVPSQASMSMVGRMTNGSLHIVSMKPSQPQVSSSLTHVSDTTRARVQNHIKSKASETSSQSGSSLMAPSHVPSVLGKALVPKDVSGKGPPPLIKTGRQSSGSNLVDHIQGYKSKQAVDASQAAPSLGGVKSEGDIDLIENTPKRLAVSHEAGSQDVKQLPEKPHGPNSALHLHQKFTDSERQLRSLSSHRYTISGNRVSRHLEEGSLTNSRDVKDALQQANATGTLSSRRVMALSTTGPISSHVSSQKPVPVIDLTDSPNNSRPSSAGQVQAKPPHHDVQRQSVLNPSSLPHSSRTNMYHPQDAPRIQQHPGILSSIRPSSAQMGYQKVLSPSHIAMHQQPTVVPVTEMYKYEYPPQGYLPPMVGHPHELCSQQAQLGPRAMPHLIMPSYQQVPLHSTLLPHYPVIHGSASTSTSWSLPSVVTPAQVSEPCPVVRKPLRQSCEVKPQSGQKTLPSPSRPRLFVRESSVERKSPGPRVKVEDDNSELVVDASKDAHGIHTQRKLEFMATLGLITPRKFTEIQEKRAQRKRRARTIASTMASETLRAKRVRSVSQSGSMKKGRLRSNKLLLSSSGSQSIDDGHGDACAVCHDSGELLMCDTCSLVYHLDCLNPPLTSVPPGTWICPHCREQLAKHDSSQWSGTLAVVQAYLKHRSECESERKSLLDRIESSKSERIQLEEKARDMSSTIIEQMQRSASLTAMRDERQTALDKLWGVFDSIKKFVKTSSNS